MEEIFLKKQKIKMISIVAIILTILGIVSVFVYVKQDVKSVIAEDEYSVGVSEVKKDGEFKLGIIGDSWVDNEKLDSPIADSLSGGGLSIDVESYSLPGRKSGEIYHDMINDNPEFNSYDLVQDDSIDALLLVAGVNDTAGHFGSEYYVKHIMNIISYANSHDKYVFILEVPEYGIEEKERFLSALKHSVYMYVNDRGKRNVIDDYRKALQTQLEETVTSGYAIIEYPEEMDDYYSNIDLYKDQFHLNDKGSSLLGNKIGEEILKHISY